MNSNQTSEVPAPKQSGNIDRIVLAGLVRDLRNVQDDIVGWLEVARQARAEAESSAALEKATSSVPRCRELLEHVSKVAKGSSVTQPHCRQPGPVIAQTLAVVKPDLPQNIRLDREIPFDLRPVAISPGDIDRMVVVILQNGREAMTEGGTLAVQAANVAIEADPGAGSQPSLIRPGRYVWVSVTDTGRGIPPEIQGRIFEPSFSTKPCGKGPGLGLATVQSLLRECGGFIDFETSPLGTTFNLYLPVAPA